MWKAWRSLNTNLAFSDIIPKLLLKAINIAIINNKHYYLLLWSIQNQRELGNFPVAFPEQWCVERK